MTVEFYGVDRLDRAGLDHRSRMDPPGQPAAIKPSTTVVLKTQGKSFRYLLVWITHAPAGVTAGPIGISELSVST